MAAEIAAEIAAENGPADVIYAANTVCHIPYIGSIFRGADYAMLFAWNHAEEIMEKAAGGHIGV